MSIPVRADKSKVAKTILKKNSIDLFLYIEDEKLCHVYETLVHRLVNIPRSSIEVQAVKAKSAIIKQHKVWKEAPAASQNTLFIADKDFDHVLENNPNECPICENFLELERYTIENYLIEEYGVIQLIRSKVSLSEQEIYDRLNFENWLEEFYKSFEELFVLFGIAHKYSIIKNNGVHLNAYVAKNGYLVNGAFLEKYRSDIKSYCELHAINFVEEYRIVKECFTYGDYIDYEKLSHGKFKLFSLLKYITFEFNNVYDPEMSKSLLAERMLLDDLTILRDKCNTLIAN